MPELTDEQIKKLNNSCKYGQGIFLQPHGVPPSVKELVVYCSYSTGGKQGGSCYGDEPEAYTKEVPQDRMMILDEVLEILKPNITLLEYRKIEKSIEKSYTSDSEYYGNYTNYTFEYIPLSKIYEILKIS